MATQVINVNPGSDDPFDRYKMPALDSVCQGRGNGKLTVVRNLSQVGRALRRNPSQLAKHLALASATSVKERDDVAVLGGHHTTSDLQKRLEEYIKGFVLCEKCNDPGTELLCFGEKKRKHLKLHCNACGHEGKCEPGKLSSYIMNNMDSAQPLQETAQHPVAAAQQLTPQEGRSEEDAKAQASRLVQDLLEQPASAQAAALRNLVHDQLHASDVVGLAIEITLARGRPIRPLWYRRDEPTALGAALAALVGSSTKAQKQLLRVLDKLTMGELKLKLPDGELKLTIGDAVAARVGAEFAPVLQALYQADALGEEAILGWAAKTRNAAAREAAEPMLRWLREAEEEDTDEESD